MKRFNFSIVLMVFFMLIIILPILGDDGKEIKHPTKQPLLTSCKARADNGASCEVKNCDGIAGCIASGRTVVCECKPATPPPLPPSPGNPKFPFSPFAQGERDYLVNRLRPFIVSLQSTAANNLATALDAVISAVDANNEENYDIAEYNYRDKRALLSQNEISSLDQWVTDNGFYR